MNRYFIPNFRNLRGTEALVCLVPQSQDCSEGQCDAWTAHRPRGDEARGPEVKMGCMYGCDQTTGYRCGCRYSYRVRKSIRK